MGEKSGSLVLGRCQRNLRIFQTRNFGARSRIAPAHQARPLVAQPLSSLPRSFAPHNLPKLWQSNIAHWERPGFESALSDLAGSRFALRRSRTRASIGI